MTDSKHRSDELNNTSASPALRQILSESERNELAELLRKSDLAPALKRTIAEKIERGELDEVDVKVFEENLRKVLKKR